jgi:hypothetical protein
MANQGSDRRTALEILAKASLAAQFPGFTRWACAQTQASSPESTPRQIAYRPTFFSAAEYRTIEVLTELIIPADESPGAHEAGVSEFIDFMAASGEKELRESMREGLRWLDSETMRQHGKVFAELSSDQQNRWLTKISVARSAAPEQHQAHRFFRVIRRYTVMGYYTSRVGLKELDYPGLRVYGESPACPHHDDPEHTRLRRD